MNEVGKLPLTEANSNRPLTAANCCYCCGREVDPIRCARCASGHAQIATLEFIWNGYLAKRVEVGWCPKCDFVWIVDGEGTHPVCRDCRERLLRVNLGEPESEPARAA
jgi:hypothetical protein